jgi:hypothetical protein
VLKRRHTWELLSSLVQSSIHDQALRRAVLEVCDANTRVNSEFKFFYRCSPTWLLMSRQRLLSFWSHSDH